MNEKTDQDNNEEEEPTFIHELNCSKSSYKKYDIGKEDLTTENLALSRNLYLSF